MSDEKTVREFERRTDEIETLCQRAVNLAAMGDWPAAAETCRRIATLANHLRDQANTRGPKFGAGVPVERRRR